MIQQEAPISNIGCPIDGQIWTGTKLAPDQTGNLKISTPNCGKVVLNEDMNTFKRGQEINGLCNCEMVNEANQGINCPNGKFMRTYYPLLKQALCCSPCMANGELRAAYDSANCREVFKNPTDTNLTCPNNNFLQGLNFTKLNTKLNCCYPKFEGQIKTQVDEMKGHCTKMGIQEQECNETVLNNMNKYCKEYGISSDECTRSNLNNVLANCDAYGLRYFDPVSGVYKNTDSYMTCHVNNFQKLDDQCQARGVTDCNWYTLNSPSTNSMIWDNKYMIGCFICCCILLLILFAIAIKDKL